MSALSSVPAGPSSDRGQQAVIAVASAARFMTGILMGTAMAVLVERSGGSNFAVSMVLTAYFLGLTVFAPTWGAVADVTGRRRAVMVTTGALATLAVLPLTVAAGVWTPIGLRALYAVFAAGFVPVMLTVVSERGGAESRGRSVGFFNSARAVGFTGGQVVAGVLLGLLAPAALYLVIAAVSVVATVAAALVVDPVEDPPGDPTVREVLAEVRRRLLPAVEDRAHLRANGLRWLYVGLALRNMTVLGVMSLMPVYLVGEVGVTEFVMGVLLAMNPAGQVVFMYLFGRVADTAGRKPLVAGGMAGSGAFGLVAATATAPGSLPARVAVAGAAFVLIAASFSAMTTGAIAFIGDVAPTERESELMGLRSTAKGVGGVLGPPLLGLVASVRGMEAAFAGGSVLAFAGAAVVVAALVESRPASGGAVPTPGDD